MNIKLISKIFALFFCSLFLVSAIAAQEVRRGEKIGEYDESEKSEAALEAVTERFIIRLSNEPATTIGFIGIYETDELSKKIKLILAKYPAVKNEIRYLYATCYPRHLTTVEFWIIPKDAERIPRPACCGDCFCPVIDVKGVEVAESPIRYLTFTADVSGKTQTEIKYRWYLSAGKIVEGQNTKTIKVDPQGAKEVRATLQIGGTCDDEICPRQASSTTKIQ